MPAEDYSNYFTVYYMNEEKVIETTMLLNNEITTDSSRESASSFGGEGDVEAKGGAKIPILTKLDIDVEGNLHGEKQKKVVDNLVYVNTKSRMLSQIIKRCKIIDIKEKTGSESFKSDLTEGDLVYINGLSLELINEEEIHGIMVLAKGALDGLTIPESGNFDLGHMVQSILKNGAAFKLLGRFKSREEPLYMKIPLDGEDMFESKYTIDDLLIGEVGVVGVCKGEITPDKMKSPLDYFQKSKTTNHVTATVVECGEEEMSAKNVEGKDGEEGTYIDVFALIQSISLNNGGEK